VLGVVYQQTSSPNEQTIPSHQVRFAIWKQGTDEHLPFYILHFVCSTAFSAISDRSLVLANSRKVLVETAESYMPVCGVAPSFLSHWFSYQVNSISAKVVTNPAFS
jgi:hypothetical protein